MPSRSKYVFFSQHLSGVGHHVRNREIAAALARDHEVFFVDGGRPIPQIIPGVTRLQLVRPDVFVIEFFPFCRWLLYAELIPAIEAARAASAGAKIICSLRDIPRTRITNENSGWDTPATLPLSFTASRSLLEQRYGTKPQPYHERVCQTLNVYFDAILVHADERVTRLDEHFPRVADLSIPLRYTGYVSQKPKRTPVNRAGGFVLLSSGGLASGRALAKPCIEAWKYLHQQGAIGNREMVIFSGLFESPLMERLRRVLCCASFAVNTSPPACAARKIDDL